MINIAKRFMARSVLKSAQKNKSFSLDNHSTSDATNIATGDQLLQFLKKEGFSTGVEPMAAPALDDQQLRHLERRQAKLAKQQLKPTGLEQHVVEKKTLVDTNKIDKFEKAVLKNFSTTDQTLNNHVFGNIPLKLVDFSKQKYYEMQNIKNPDGKRQVYDQLLDKLRIMFDVAYTIEDFNELKMYGLNTDQLLALLQSQNFVQNADLTRLVDCLKAIQKARQLKAFKEYPEIQSVVKQLSNEACLVQLPESYVSSLAHAVSKMKIDDEIIWFSLASHLSSRHEQFSIRNLSTFTYALTNISRLKPVILNFDDLFRKLELSFIKKFDSSSNQTTGQDIAITLTSYSKSQNGSIQFWQAMEAVVIKNAHQLSPQELSNVIYSYYKAENSHKTSLFQALKPTVKSLIHRMKPIELCQILMAFTETDPDVLMDDELMEMFQIEFKGRYESMNPQDSSTFYYCYTKLGYRGDGLFYKYIQKAVTKTIRSFEGPHLRLMFFKFDEEEQTRLNKGVRNRLIEHCKYLVREKLIKGYDAHNIYMHTAKLKYEKPDHHDYVINLQVEKEPAKNFQYHDLHIELRNYLERIRYFN